MCRPQSHIGRFGNQFVQQDENHSCHYHWLALRLASRRQAMCHFDFAPPLRRCLLSRIMSVMSAAGRISNGPAFTPGCFDINWIA